MIILLLLVLPLSLLVVCKCLTYTPPVIVEEVQEYPHLCVEKCFIVFGHTAKGEGVTHEIFAGNSLEALDKLQASYPDQTFIYAIQR